MLYVKTEKDNGLIQFTPIRDENIYIKCDRCGKIVAVEDPMAMLEEVYGLSATFNKSFNLCFECLDEVCEGEG